MRFVKKLSILSGLAIAVLGASKSQADISITVYPSLAPNAYGSPSWTQYQANALVGIQNGGTTVGTGAAQYTNLGDGATLDYREAVVTGFDSWLGVAAPNTPAYSGESGNRMTFGVDIKGNGTKIDIADLSFNATSSDPGNTLGFSYGAGEYDYEPDYFGIIYGTNGSPDTIVDSGDPTQLVDEIVGRGSGNSLDAYEDADAVSNFGYDPYPAGATDQDRINDTAAVFGITSDFSFTGSYSLGDATGSATVNYSGVPEPTSLSMIGLCGVIALRRRRRLASEN